MTGTHRTTIYIPKFHGIEIDVEGEFSYDMANDGIGFYEFWGQKCFDRGSDYPVFVNFEGQLSPLDLRTDVLRHLRPLNLTRKRFRKMYRQLLANVAEYLDKADPAKYISENDCIESLP